MDREAAAEVAAVRDEVARRVADFAGDRIVVGVSGGSDSVGLLSSLAILQESMALQLVVAHLNHGVRGHEAEADAAFVAVTAERLGLPVELGRWQPTRSAHFESDARRARLSWLSEVAQKHKARAVALGHTRDDQAETILHRIMRGTGVRGLVGIPRARQLTNGVVLIRPMLSLSREAIRQFLRAIGQQWREDATNNDPQQMRARLRHNLIPKLREEYNPRIVDALVRLGDTARDELQIAHAWIDDWLCSHISSPDSMQMCIHRPALQALAAAARLQVIRAAWANAGWPEREMTREAWIRLVTLIDQGTGARTQVPGATARVEANLVRLQRRESH